MNLVKEILEWLLAIYLGVHITYKVIKAHNKLLKSIPIGESKEWILMLPSGHVIAINCTNLDGNASKWTMGFFKITRRK